MLCLDVGTQGGLHPGSLSSWLLCTAGLLPLGLAHFQCLTEQGSDLLPVHSSWVTLLALLLLCHMRDRRSPLQPYVRLLPSPAGARLRAICTHGPEGTDLLLFRQVASLIQTSHVPVERLAELVVGSAR